MLGRWRLSLRVFALRPLALAEGVGIRGPGSLHLWPAGAGVSRSC